MKVLVIEFDVRKEDDGDIILCAADLVVPIITEEHKQDFEERGVKASHLLDECIIEFIRTESAVHARLPDIISINPIEWQPTSNRVFIQLMGDYRSLFATWNQ